MFKPKLTQFFFNTVKVDYVESILRSRFKEKFPDHPLAKRSLKKPKSMKCLQQASGTLDCGVIVCVQIENAFRGKSSPVGEYSDSDAGLYRAKMISWFMDPMKIFW